MRRSARIEVAFVQRTHIRGSAGLPPNKALKLTPESRAVTTCGTVLAAGAAVPALAVSAFWDQDWCAPIS